MLPSLWHTHSICEDNLEGSTRSCEGYRYIFLESFSSGTMLKHGTDYGRIYFKNSGSGQEIFSTHLI